MAKGQNFCPIYREHIRASYPPEIHSFLSTLPLSDYSSHSRCTVEQCRGRVSRADNSPKHTADCEGCTFVTPSKADVKKCITDGHIPLLRFRQSKHGRLQVEVVKASFETRYIAISHVWTGGLGNPNDNELYECQLRKVAASGKQIRRIIERQRIPSIPTLFRQLYRKIVLGDIDLFWMDTLCIPVRETENDVETDASRTMRGKAIDRMTQVYAGAHSVLVIDPEIRHLDNGIMDTDRNQFFGRFIRSDWMRRCWTYQEGAMAGRLFAMLSTEPVYLTQQRYMIAREGTSEVNSLSQELTKWISNLPGPRETQEYASRRLIIGQDQEAFGVVWKALISRTTSQEADRYLIFALMLNFIVSPLLAADMRPNLGRQSRTIFNSLVQIPLDFLYDQTTNPSAACWLPERMSSRTFSNNYLIRRSFKKPWLTLTFDAAMAGSVTPGLYLLPDRGLYDGGLVISTHSGQHSIDMILSEIYLGAIRPSSALILLVKDTNVPEDEFRTRAALFERISKTGPPNTWQLRKICAMDCTLSVNVRPSVCSENLLLTLPGCAFDIFCGKCDSTIQSCLRLGALTQAIDFGDALRLNIHRDVTSMADVGITVTVPMYMHRDAHILLFLTMYLILTGLIGCIPSRISFSPAWLVVIIWVALLPVLIDLFETMDRTKRLGNDIMHARWIDALTPDQGSALPRRVKLLKRINHGPIWTWTQLSLGILFTVLGIKYFDNRDRRVMIVLGIMWILELGVRWALELTCNYYWKLGKNNPLVQEFLQDSRLTKWCKKVLGWPKDIPMAERQHWYGD